MDRTKEYSMPQLHACSRLLELGVLGTDPAGRENQYIYTFFFMYIRTIL